MNIKKNNIELFYFTKISIPFVIKKQSILEKKELNILLHKDKKLKPKRRKEVIFFILISGKNYY